MGAYITDRRLYLTADRARVVEEGDPEAAFLLASKGKELDAATVERYGLDQAPGKAVAAPPRDKAVKRAANKGGA